MSKYFEEEEPTCVQECGYKADDCRVSCGNCIDACINGVASCCKSFFNYGSDPLLAAGSEVLPPWRKLYVEFVNRVTWHGLKYTELRSRFIFRKFAWHLIILAACTLFIFIITQNAIKLLSYPTSITVKVNYTDTLPFSAVTICNSNKYRLTELHKMDLLDLMVYDKNTNNCDYCDEYLYYPGICRIEKPENSEHFTYNFSQVTRRVCMNLCSNTYDTQCSGFLFDRAGKNCQLSSYTGDWLKGTCPPPNMTSYEFYRRKRKTTSQISHCTFEEKQCIFVNEVGANDDWVLQEAYDSFVMKDNTLNLGSGHVVSLLTTELKPNYFARLTSPYINTTDMCLEFFYWFQTDRTSPDSIPTLTVSSVSEQKVKKDLTSTSKYMQDWTRFYVDLPAGINQIVIEGKRAQFGKNGIALDDVSITNCSQKDAVQSCKITRRGSAYVGKANMSAAGEPCARWEAVKSNLIYKLPDKTLKNAENYCRFIPQENWTEPSCFVKTETSYKIAVCNISYCECSSSTSFFKCDGGLCLPDNLRCNGIKDCNDGTDEICPSLTNVVCSFDDSYICGYTRDRLGSLQWTFTASGNLVRYTKASIYSNITALASVMLVESIYGMTGDKVRLISPLWTFTGNTLISIQYIMSSSGNDKDNGFSGLYVYKGSQLFTPLRLLFKNTDFSSEEFNKKEFCVPTGTYHLIFEGVQGRPYEQIIALASVNVISVGECQLNYKETTEEPGDLDCAFSSLCGYKFTSTSAYFNYTFAYSKTLSTMSSGPACGNTFNGVEGVITSPNYPNNYPNKLDCKFSIEAPDGATITITFQEFSIEAESDCSFDRLEFIDPLSDNTKLYCGSTLPPPVISKGNKVSFLFSTDSNVNNGNFKITYVTTVEKKVGFALQFKYTGESLLQSYNQVAKLISPEQTLSTKSCLAIEFIALAQMRILMIYLDKNGLYREKTLFKVPKSLGRDWSRLYIDLNATTPATALKPAPTADQISSFSIVIEVTISELLSPDAATIRNISLTQDKCLQRVRSNTLKCDFEDLNQCGYLDVSAGDVHWNRVFDEDSSVHYMSAYFDVTEQSSAVLKSTNLIIDSNKCLQIRYLATDPNFEIEVSSSSTSGEVTRQQLSSGDAAIINYNVKAGQQEIYIEVSPPSSTEYIRTAASEVRIRDINLLNQACPTATRTEENINCNFDTVFVCNFITNFPYGAPWSWVPYRNIIDLGNATNAGSSSSGSSSSGSSSSGGSSSGSSIAVTDLNSKKPKVLDGVDHGSVMMFNKSSSNNIMKGIMSSPLMTLNNTFSMTFEVMTSNPKTTAFSIYYGTELGLVTGKLMEVQLGPSLIWINKTICLPGKSMYIFFVADVANTKDFVMLDNVVSSKTACNASFSDPNLVCPLKETGPGCSSTLFSWSSTTQWLGTSYVQNGFNPDREDCVYVFDRSEGQFDFKEDRKNQRSNLTGCDMYIRGRGQIKVNLWFESFESLNCATQYLEVWRKDASDAAPSSPTKYCNSVIISNLSVVDVLQIHIATEAGYPRFVMKYNYTVPSTKDYLAGLYYQSQQQQLTTTTTTTTSSSTTSPTTIFNQQPTTTTTQQPLTLVKNVASWISPIKTLTNNSVCISFDVALLSASVEISALYKFKNANVKQMNVFQASKYKEDQLYWTNATFQVNFDPPLGSPTDNNLIVQFHFLFSLNLDQPAKKSYSGYDIVSGFNNFQMVDGNCPRLTEMDQTSPPICAVDSKSCNFFDASGGISRWVRASHRAKEDRMNDCKVNSDSSTYKGETSQTISGRKCQAWKQQTPQKHNQDSGDYFVGGNLDNTGNKCRNPSNPFIPRNSWCYTMDVKQRREYCDVPFCVDNLYQVEFAANLMSAATLLSQPMKITRSFCLTFKYIVESSFIQFEVYTLDENNVEIRSNIPALSDSSSLSAAQRFSRVDNVIVYTSVTNEANITVDPGVQRIKFVAKKLDSQSNLKVMISEISNRAGTCENVPASLLAADSGLVVRNYTGPKLARTEYKELIFNDLNDLNILTLNEQLSHQQADLIHTCSFDNKTCADSDILSVQTDLGRCYTFNFDGSKKVSITGSEFGASFVLNIEEYEHVEGFTTGAGVKIQLHNHSDISSMKDLSVAAMPGVHNFGVVSLKKSIIMLPPYGTCGMYPLDYYDLYDTEPYSEARCKLERKTKKVLRKCGCQDAYMPGYQRMCSLKETMYCLNNTVSKSSANQCPIPCDTTSYTMQMSQSKLSALGLNELLNGKRLDVEKKYLNALELKHRVDEINMKSLIQLFEESLTGLTQFRDFIYYMLLFQETSTLDHVEKAIEAFINLAAEDVRNIGNQLMLSVNTTIVKLENAKEVYLLDSLQSAYISVAYYRDLNTDEGGKYNDANQLNTRLTDESIDWYLKSSNDASDKISTLKHVLITFLSLSSQRQRLDCSNDNGEKSLTEDCRCRMSQLPDRLDQLAKQFANISILLSARSGSVTANDWLGKFDLQLTNSLLEQLNDVISCSSDYDSTLSTFKNWLKSDNIMNYNIRNNISQSLNPQTTLVILNQVSMWIQDLKANYSASKITKKELAERMTSEQTELALRNISNIVSDITTNVVAPFQDTISQVDQQVVATYQRFLGYLVKFYNLTKDENIDSLARNLNIWRKPSANLEIPDDIKFTLSSQETWQVWLKEQTLTAFQRDRSKDRLTFLSENYFLPLRSKIQTFFTDLNVKYDIAKLSMEKLQTSLSAFLATTAIDENFMGSNFLVVDIYFGDLNYEITEMIPAYTITDFFGQLGGFFGLLMGCSVITMFECLDFVFYHIIVKIYEKIEQRRMKRRHVIHVDPDDDPLPPPPAIPQFTVTPAATTSDGGGGGKTGGSGGGRKLQGITEDGEEEENSPDMNNNRNPLRGL